MGVFGERMTEIRDKILAQIWGWNRIIRDLPQDAIHEVQKLLRGTEDELRRIEDFYDRKKPRK